MRRSTLLPIGFAMLTACSVGPRFEPPNPAAPTQWNAAATGASEPKSKVVSDSVDAQWWTQFNDPLLIELIERARDANLDVRIATLRVAQSRAQRDSVAGGKAPSVTGSASFQRQRQSEFGSATRMGAPANVLSEPFDVYQAGFDASWELDLWGRVRRAVEVADAAVAASTEDLHAAQLSMVAEVARNYLELRGVQNQLRISKSDIAASASLLELIEFRASGGLVTQLDVVSQQARLADSRSRVPQLQDSETQLVNALALLLGEQPGVLAAQLREVRPVPAPPPQVAGGIPAEIARRRPDIRGAEARLHAATAEIGVAVADLYPRITLTGSFLNQSLDAADLTDWGARQWVVGPSLYLPIFTGGRLRSVVELRKLQQQEAAVNYQRAVLRAWHEIDNALSAYAAEQRRNQELIVAVAASQDAYGIARLRYEHGLTNFLVALDAQRTLLQAERDFSDSNTLLSTHLVGLYKSLGGGWEKLM